MKTDLVVAGYLIHEGRVLLIHHKKLSLWLPPGGHIEKDEVPDDALIREFKEELDLDIELLSRNDVPMSGNIKRQLAVPFYVNLHSVGNHDHCCFYYLCKLKGKNKPKFLKSELKGFAWFSPEELKQEKVPADVKSIALRAFEITKSEN